MSGPLRAGGISVSFAGLTALDAVDLEIGEGEILGLIGPNGSGKTTCLNVLSGFVRPGGGTIRMGELDLSRWNPRQRSRAGLVRTFQAVRLFSGLTVRENLEAAASGTGVRRRDARARAETLIDDLQLSDFAESLGSALPAGVSRRAGIGRALAVSPRFLMLDEPAAGANEAEGAELVRMIRRIPEAHGCGVLLVEHDFHLIRGCCSRLQVLDAGRTIFVGSVEDAVSDPDVVAAYFGAAGEEWGVA